MLTIPFDNRSALQRLLHQKNNQLLSILKEGKIPFLDRKGLYRDIISLCKAITSVERKG
jgi:hypothetical protein